MEKENLRKFIHTIYNISGKVHQIRNMDIWLSSGIKVNTAILSTLDVISNNSSLNMSEISTKMELTKGAISQMANKLQQKGLIEKQKMADNAKDTYLIVTEQGKAALKEYYALHDKLYFGIFDLISEYSDQEEEAILDFLNQSNQLFSNFKGHLDVITNENQDKTMDCDKNTRRKDDIEC